MRSARWYGPGDIRVERVPEPQCGQDQALIRVLWCGLCGSDLEEYREGPVVIPVDADTGKAAPLTLGHEFVGVVELAAVDGTGPPAGTIVVPDVVFGCGSCWWCRHHEEGLCPDLSVLGQQIDGGLAEFVAARASRLVVVPKRVPVMHAALAEPLAVAVRAARAAGGLTGRGVLVIGGGSVGQLMARVARATGAHPVVVIDPSPIRRGLAVKMGVDAALPPDQIDAAAIHFPERGIDVVIEASGAAGQPRKAAGMARRGGTVVLLGVSPHPESLDLLDVVLHEKTIRGSAAHMYDDDVQVAIDLLASGSVSAEGLISSCVELENAAEAFCQLATGDDATIKILIDCSPTSPTRIRCPE